MEERIRKIFKTLLQHLLDNKTASHSELSQVLASLTNRTDHWEKRSMRDFRMIKKLKRGIYTVDWIGANAMIESLGINRVLPIVLIGDESFKKQSFDKLKEISIVPKGHIAVTEIIKGYDPFQAIEGTVEFIEKLLWEYKVFIDFVGMPDFAVVTLMTVSHRYQLTNLYKGRFLNI